MKEYAASFYKGYKWRKLSKLYMESKNYVCERCGKPASICHHRIYITPANISNPAITLNPDNLEALCMDCHNKEHGSRQSKVIFDAAGNVVGVKESAEIEDYKEAVKNIDLQKNGFKKAAYNRFSTVG